MSSSDIEALALTANFSATAFTILVNCLKNNGALKPTQFEDALRWTVSQPNAERIRLDYQFLEQLLNNLERQNPDKTPPQLPPTLRVIQGGKPDAT